MPDKDRVYEIEKRCEKATPGQWHWGFWLISKHQQDGNPNVIYEFKAVDEPSSDSELMLSNVPYGTRALWGKRPILLSAIPTGYGGEVSVDISDADADFISHARKDIPYLISIVHAADRLAWEIHDHIEWSKSRGGGYHDNVMDEALATWQEARMEKA